MTHMRRPGEIPEKAPDTGVLTDSSFSRRVYVFTYSDLCCVSSWDGRNVCLHLAHFFAAYSVNAGIRDLLSSEQLNPGLFLFFFFFFQPLLSFPAPERRDARAAHAAKRAAAEKSLHAKLN